MIEDALEPRLFQSLSRGGALRAARQRSTSAGTVYTVGHSTRTTRELLDLLRAHGVEQVVDVRTLPRSRHNPQFNRPALSRWHPDYAEAFAAYIKRT